MKHADRRRSLAWCLALLALLTVCLAPRSAIAEPKGRVDKKSKLEARRAQVRARILREVGIDQKKGDAVEKVLRKYEPERQKLMREQRAEKLALRDLLRSNSDDDKAYKKALDGLRSARRKLHTVQEKELDELAKLLTPKQQAKLYAALQRLRRKLATRRAAAAQQ
jgi:Spy/CpxP family protein refolding chaperone